MLVARQRAVLRESPADCDWEPRLVEQAARIGPAHRNSEGLGCAQATRQTPLGGRRIIKKKKFLQVLCIF